MPQHHKVAPLSDAAFRLHITAMAWSVESKSDGRIPLGVPKTLTCAPRGKALVNVLSELVTTKVWLSLGDDGYEIHDFLQWNLSAKDIAARSEAKAIAGQAGGRARVKHLLEASLRDAQAESKPLSLSLPKSRPERDLSDRRAAPDVSQDSLDSFVADPRLLLERENVRKLFAAWRTSTGHADAKFDKKRETRLRSRLRDGFTYEQLILVLKNWRNDPYLAGSSGKVYDGIETLFRDVAQVERLIALIAPARPVAQHRAELRNEAQDLNADHDTRERLAAAKKVREMSEFADRMAAEEQS
jgi:hypothetical protein